LDDYFIKGWIYKNVYAHSDREVLNFTRKIDKIYEKELLARLNILLQDTNRYLYIIIKYRNTIKSEDIAQIIT